MRVRFLVALLAAVVAMATLSTACRKKPEPVPTPIEAPAPVEPAKPAPPEPKPVERFEKPSEEVVPAEPTAEELNRQGVLKTVYFDYDSAELSAQARDLLQANASWLKANAKRTIAVEGHCDERGSVDYNLALGSRRANAVRDYLQALGVEPSRIRPVSFGKERPAIEGHDESAWSRNRRAEFVVEP